MTLKYESEILFDLMKRDGVSSPSNVLPYESVMSFANIAEVNNNNESKINFTY